MRLVTLLLVPVLAVCLAGGVVTVASHETDTEFLYRQQHPTTLEPQQMQNAVVKARDPAPSGHGAPAIDASCTPGTKPPERNPWFCTVHYQSGHRIRYRIVVATDGTFNGLDRTGQFGVRGHVAGVALPTGG